MKSLISKLKKKMSKDSESAWEGTLADYLEILSKKPELNMGAHERVLRMIESHGWEENEDGTKTYNFFSQHLFGLEDSLDEIMSYLRAAASGSEVGRRILLMYGPTSSGKSQLSILLKRGLEAFSKTEDGAVYALAESTMFEDTMCAIPN
jgi:serine protein kinase